MLAPETPYPMAGGGAIRTASLLHYLALHYDTDLIVFRQPGSPDPALALPAGLAQRVATIELSSNGRSTAARVVRNASRVLRRVPPLTDRFAGFGDEITRGIGGRQYDLGIVEHFWCAPYWPVLAPCCRKTVVDLHNVESVLHARCAASPGLEGLAHGVFERASRQLEQAWLPRFDIVLVTSGDDAAAVGRIAADAHTSVYPNALPAMPQPPHIDEEAVVFSGNLEYHPNRTAVRYFRREIWPLLRDRWPDLNWRLVGMNPEFVREFTSGDPRIDVRGSVENAVTELARARVAIVPLLSGSGTRLKILEAWAAGLPVVSTSIGAEGLGARDGEHLLIADSAVAFVEAVSRLLACKQLRAGLGEAGRLLLEKEFTWEKAWAKLDF